MAFGAKIEGVTCPIVIEGAELQTTVRNGAALKQADANDAKGNTNDRTHYGAGSTSYTATFVVAGQTTIKTKIGKTNLVESIAVNTTNTAFPTVAVTWRKYAPDVKICGCDFDVEFPIPECKTAAELGAFSLAEGALLNSSNITFSCQVHEEGDADGNVKIAAFFGGNATGSATAVQPGVGAVTVTPSGEWKLTVEEPTINASNTAYATANFSFSKFLVESPTV